MTDPSIKKMKSGNEFLNFFFVHNESDGIGFSNIAIGVNYFKTLTTDIKSLYKGQDVIITGKILSNKVNEKLYYSIKAENILPIILEEKKPEEKKEKKEKKKQPKKEITINPKPITVQQETFKSNYEYIYGSDMDDLPF